ncbi:MAG: hypothetical protein RR138_06960 [Akkermansia sp.]
MFSKRKKASSEFSEIDRASRDLLVRISELEALVGKSNEIKAMQPDRNTLPPPDRVRESRQNRTLKVAVARGNVRNSQRELRDNSVLLLLLIASIAASVFWILRLFDQA